MRNLLIVLADGLGFLMCLAAFYAMIVTLNDIHDEATLHVTAVEVVSHDRR